ncbi:FeoA family protein [Pseudoduganella sp. SL102]|uniref:FeoA family protein n=1 Tax=Pseudoduganella sp. SL102 TaxID=2995154 RepID=UPI0027D98691|nr:FeoA family protein [Pseudoduganella sp. SL102]
MQTIIETPSGWFDGNRPTAVSSRKGAKRGAGNPSLSMGGYSANLAVFLMRIIIITFPILPQHRVQCKRYLQIQTIRISLYNEQIDFPQRTAMTSAPSPINLDALATGKSGTVVRVAPGNPADHEDGADLARRLMELGFVPGEKIRMLKRGMPGGEPLAVRVGNSTFALRRFEAALVAVQPDSVQPDAVQPAAVQL